MEFNSYLAELLYLHAERKARKKETIELSKFDYKVAQAAGFDMAQFKIAPPRYMRQ